MPKTLVKRIVRVLAVAVGLFAVAAVAIYLATPANIRHPQFEHAHMRFQLLVDGQAVNFADDAFQAPTTAVCTDAITEEPMHFHDKKDQFLHLHWKNITGGQVLKYYGWDLIGGLPGTLGYRFDMLPGATNVPVHGNVLPRAPGDATLWVYVGDQNSFTQKPMTDFIKQDLESFFGVTSSVHPQHAWWQQLFAAKASAQTVETEEQKLTRVHNMLGNIIIFAQKDKPTDQQIKERFTKLEPLPNSSCGG